MNIFTSFFTFLILGGSLSSVLSIATVEELNIPQYMGRWYQMYADKFVLSTFERNAVCMTADYYVQDDGNINVFNGQNHGEESGELETISGYATLPDASKPGQLKVFFDSAGPPGGAPYWVVKLGPIDSSTDQYSYAVVTDNTQTSLFVLARNVDEFNEKYDAEVLEFMKNNGFTGFRNSPIATVQNDQCAYRPVPSSTVSATQMSVKTNHEDQKVIDDTFQSFSKHINNLMTSFDNQIKTINMNKFFSKFRFGFGQSAPPTVSKVDLDSYVGRWYQIYANKLVYLTFERNGVCQTADYNKLDDGSGITVVNSQNTGNPSGEITDISGTAVITNTEEPGQLTLQFDTVPFPGDYWIVKLGPVLDGEYQYSIVTTPNMSQLFVIARDVESFKANYDDEVLAWLNEKGFTGTSAPIPSVQESDCAYAEPSMMSYHKLIMGKEKDTEDQLKLRGLNPTSIKY